MLYQEVIPGKIYHVIGHKHNKTYTKICSFRTWKGYEQLCLDKYLAIELKKYTRETNPCWLCSDIQWEVREASFNEIQWFEACERAGKLVEQPKTEEYAIY